MKSRIFTCLLLASLPLQAHQQGGRTITVREIQPIALPPPPAPPPAPVAMDPALLARIDDYLITHPRNEILFLGATVYRSKNSPPRTLVRYWANGRGEPVTFWSSADFALIAGGINSFVNGVIVNGITIYLMSQFSSRFLLSSVRTHADAEKGLKVWRR